MGLAENTGCISIKTNGSCKG